MFTILLLFSTANYVLGNFLFSIFISVNLFYAKFIFCNEFISDFIDDNIFDEVKLCFIRATDFLWDFAILKKYFGIKYDIYAFFWSNFSYFSSSLEHSKTKFDVVRVSNHPWSYF